jgi:hypothetical protein
VGHAATPAANRGGSSRLPDREGRRTAGGRVHGQDGCRPAVGHEARGARVCPPDRPGRAGGHPRPVNPVAASTRGTPGCPILVAAWESIRGARVDPRCERHDDARRNARPGAKARRPPALNRRPERSCIRGKQLSRSRYRVPWWLLRKGWARRRGGERLVVAGAVAEAPAGAPWPFRRRGAPWSRARPSAGCGWP